MNAEVTDTPLQEVMRESLNKHMLVDAAGK